jgi:hypothetical protein
MKQLLGARTGQPDEYALDNNLGLQPITGSLDYSPREVPDDFRLGLLVKKLAQIPNLAPTE